MNFKR